MKQRYVRGDTFVNNDKTSPYHSKSFVILNTSFYQEPLHNVQYLHDNSYVRYFDKYIEDTCLQTGHVDYEVAAFEQNAIETLLKTISDNETKGFPSDEMDFAPSSKGTEAAAQVISIHDVYIKKYGYDDNKTIRVFNWLKRA